MTLLLLTLLLAEQNFPATTIFEPLASRHVAVADDGEIYMLNMADANVLHHKKDGSTATFTRRGEGPGELNNPWSLVVEGDKVYVVDFLKGIQLFNRTGVFQKKIDLPQRFVQPVKVAGGWVYAKDPFDMQEPSQLFWSDDEGSTEVTLAAYANGVRGVFMDVKEDKTVHLDFNPAIDRPYMLTNADRTRLYFYQPGSSKITVFDMKTRSVTEELALNREPRAFNESWGQAKMEEMAKNVILNGEKARTKMNPKFPEYFPVVADMFMGPKGNLWLETDESFFNKDAALLVLSQKGKPATTPYHKALSGRLVRVIGSDAYVLSYDRENEHALVAKVALSELNAYVKKVPNTEDDEKQVGMNINW